MVSARDITIKRSHYQNVASIKGERREASNRFRGSGECVNFTKICYLYAWI